MTLEESAVLMTDPAFRNRVKTAALQYATGIMGQAYNSRSRAMWAQATMQSPDVTAATLTPNVVMNVNVQTLGPTIPDPDLIAAVQVTADMMM